jgi:hypothetical protein
MSKMPVAPGNCAVAWSQIHSAPSPRTVIEAHAWIPKRFIHCCHFGAKVSIDSMAANALRTLGLGKVLLSHASGVAVRPSGRLAKMAIFMSRQPVSVLTLTPSV